MSLSFHTKQISLNPGDIIWFQSHMIKTPYFIFKDSKSYSNYNRLVIKYRFNNKKMLGMCVSIGDCGYNNMLKIFIDGMFIYIEPAKYEIGSLDFI